MDEGLSAFLRRARHRSYDPAAFTTASTATTTARFGEVASARSRVVGVTGLIRVVRVGALPRERSDTAVVGGKPHCSSLLRRVRFECVRLPKAVHLRISSAQELNIKENQRQKPLARHLKFLY